MDPTVVAAWIAAGVSVLTLIGTLAAQYLGRRGTKDDTEKAFAEQRGQLNETLKAQREQLDLTLAEQGRQLDRTLAEQRTRTWNERFGAAADQLGSDKPAAVRLAGVYAMAGLADDWEANRQTCVDVLCAYLRMPYEPEPGKDSPILEQLAFQSSREVRHTVIRVITSHLQEGAAVPWQGLNFDFTSVVFDGGNFRGARFSGGDVSFVAAEFSGGTVDFYGAHFFAGAVDFFGAKFCGSKVSFWSAEFSGGEVNFLNAKFSGGTVDFIGAKFSGGTVRFWSAEFSGGDISFSAGFCGGDVSFVAAEFSGGKVSFSGAKFSGSEVSFPSAEFSGSEVSFIRSEFSGGTVDFSGASDWSVPPTFSWTGMPPSGVKALPGPQVSLF